MARTRRPAVHHATILRELRVDHTELISATTMRVRLVGEQLGRFDVAGGEAPAFESLGFDDVVKVLVPAAGSTRPPLPMQGPDRLEWGGAGGRPVAKDYTPRHVSTDAITLDFVLHEVGFAAAWAQRAVPGDPAWIVGPTRSLLMPPDIDRFVAVADETAVPAIGRLLDEADDQFQASIVLYVPGPDSVQELAERAGVDVRWVHSVEAWHAEVERIDVRDDTFCWAGGEAAEMRRIRQHWTACGVARDRLDVTGYWRRG